MSVALALADAGTGASCLDWMSVPLEDLSVWVESVADRQKELERREKRKNGR